MKRINICKNKQRKLVRGKLVCAWSQNSKFFIILLEGNKYGVYRASDGEQVCVMSRQYFEPAISVG
jgi:hypothetical protein